MYVTSLQGGVALLLQIIAAVPTLRSYGVCLWEVVTGDIPVRGYLRDVEVPVECPPEVRQLISDCMESDPKRRPTAEGLVCAPAQCAACTACTVYRLHCVPSALCAAGFVCRLHCSLHATL